MKRIVALACALLSAVLLASCGSNAHFYELPSVYSNGFKDAAKNLERNGFQYNPSYTYNSANSSKLNSTGKETGAGWVGNPSDNPIGETCFVQFFDKNGKELDANALSSMKENPRVRMSWHDGSVDDAEATASKLQSLCGFSNRFGEGWALGIKDGVWSSFGTATLNGADGEWEIRIVPDSQSTGGSPMIMVEWNPYREDFTEADARDGAKYWSK